VATRPGWAMVAEHSPEAIIPLNDRGEVFMAKMLARYSAAAGSKESRVAGHSVTHNNHSTHIVNDSSLHAGHITVQASDPDRMMSAMRRKIAHKRLASRV